MNHNDDNHDNSNITTVFLLVSSLSEYSSPHPPTSESALYDRPNVSSHGNYPLQQGYDRCGLTFHIAACPTPSASLVCYLSFGEGESALSAQIYRMQLVFKANAIRCRWALSTETKLYCATLCAKQNLSLSRFKGIYFH